MATENQPESHLSRSTCHRVHSCDRGRGPPPPPPPPPGVGGGSPRRAVERRGGSDGHSGREAKLLEKQIVLGLRKSGKQLHAGKDGRHAIEARAQVA
jgi:hypothetical protein